MRPSTRPSTRRRALAALALLPALTAPACAGQEQDRSRERERSAAREVAREAGVPSPTPAERVDPGDFVRRITNLYLPLEPGTTLTYEGTGGDGGDGRERNVVEVTHRTRTILGVTATVVRDRVYREGELIEDTRDWFAQDRQGNVWYFGEDSREIRNGEVVSREGSWEAGRGGAAPGIVMPGDPQPGDVYSQENAPGVAEDRAEVMSLVAAVDVPHGSYENVLKTRETTPLEPKAVEHKFYARDVGLVAEKAAGAGGEHLELVRLERP